MKPRNKILLGGILFLAVASTSYYLIDRYVVGDEQKNNENENNTTDEPITRALKTDEQTFFSELFLDNPGFLMNFYSTATDLSISLILEKGQGSNLLKELTTAQKTAIINADFATASNYADLIANPDSAFNVIVDANLMRALYNDKTGLTYTNENSSNLWIYNETYDVYYNAIPYGMESSFNNYYTFDDATIDGTVYNINYTAYYKPTADSPDYNASDPNYKEKLYDGQIVLEEISAGHYHFKSNLQDEE